MLAQHSSKSVEHYTPRTILNAAHIVMGGIDLDPASTHRVNENLVRATSIFTRDDDGLSRKWSGRVWLNPPGGKVKNRSNAVVWWNKLVEEYKIGNVEQALFLGFSIEILSTSQGGTWIGDFPCCFPRTRIDFLKETNPGFFEEGGSPSHANVIAYLPPKRDPEAVLRFVNIFSAFGECR